MKTNETLFLKSLTLQNFATFENQTIKFNHRFNAIIGETGSGKSLILDALQMIFGARTDRKLIRKNAEFSSMEAIFESNDEEIKSYFNEIGHPFDGNEIVVKRIIYTNDSSKSFLNYQSCSATALNNFSKRYVDLVGQFENQKLLSEDYQLVLLDSYSKLSSDIQVYQNLFNQLQTLRKELCDLTHEKGLKNQREDYIKFQLEELAKLNPSIEDEQELLKKKELILNTEKRASLVSSLSQSVSEGEVNLIDVIKSCISRIEKNQSIINPEILSKFYEAKTLVEDISFDLSKDQDFVSDENIDSIIDRLDLYSKLKRKFGGNTESMMKTYHDFQNEIQGFGQVDERIQVVTKKIAELESKCLAFAEELHNIRTEKAEELSKELTAKVRDLKMNGASILLKVTRLDHLSLRGLSKIDFIAETNPGEGFFKVKEIASGGELSRILLAIRQILSSTDSISVFLFDEIDTGIGGETAVTIGKSLQQVALHSQVLAITHLPQIANFADHLINVSKSTLQGEDGPRTVSLIELINADKKNEYIKNLAGIH